jgi:hypothetical protein
MTTQQIYAICNTVFPQVIGQSAIDTVDVSSLGKNGEAVDNFTNGKELFHGKMLDLIIKILQDNEEFIIPNVPYLYDESSDWGGMIEEYYFDMPEAEADTSLNVGTQGYSPAIPSPRKLPLTVRVYKKEILGRAYEWTIPDSLLLASAFKSEAGMASYISGLITTVENRYKLDIANVARLARARFLATVINTPDTESVINVLSLYKEANPDTTLDEDSCWRDKDFLIFLSETIAKYKERMTDGPSSHFINELTDNETKYVRDVHDSDLIFEILGDALRSIRFYAESNIFNPEKITFGGYSEIPYWVGEGDGSFSDYSTIDVKLGEDDGSDIEVTQKGVVAVMYHKKSIMQTLNKPRRWSFYNQKDAYTNMGIQARTSINYKYSYPVLIFVVADADTP